MKLHELKALLQFWQDLQIEHWTLLVLSFFTLVRLAEILDIVWRHVFLEEKYVYLPWSKNDPEGEGTYVTLLPEALDALVRLKESLRFPPEPSAKIFSIPQSSLNPWFAAQCAKAHIGPYTWYHLKHGGATHFTLLSWSFSHIKRHGRWKSDQAARVYIHAPVSL